MVLDWLFSNACVLTLDPRQPTATLVGLRGRRIAFVGSSDELSRLRGPRTRVLDCQGMTLLPGFEDAHLHLLALASCLRSVDCRPGQVASIGEIVASLRQRAGQTPQGAWVRGWGYDEPLLRERRHPMRWDLDEAAPYHPVRLDHRTGHASVLNSLALRLLGITSDTPDPPQGVIQRDEATGEPTGLLLEMGEFLSLRLAGYRDQGEVAQGIQAANR
ncbi:MAG: amidohydrolase family protein, partial [Dehalococcoidia bacterium]